MINVLIDTIKVFNVTVNVTNVTIHMDIIGWTDYLCKLHNMDKLALNILYTVYIYSYT